MKDYYHYTTTATSYNYNSINHTFVLNTASSQVGSSITSMPGLSITVLPSAQPSLTADHHLYCVIARVTIADA